MLFLSPNFFLTQSCDSTLLKLPNGVDKYRSLYNQTTHCIVVDKRS